MKFIPDENDEPTLDVPYFGEARKEEGWQGQGTTRSYDSLKSLVTQAMARLGGIVHGIPRGHYKIGGFERAGAQIHYSLEGPGGQMFYGRMDVAALPVHKPSHSIRYEEILRKRQEKSLSMALYNVVQALKAQWVLKQMNPAYVPLMPWLLAKDDKTISETYIDAGIGLLPEPRDESDAVPGEFREIGDDDE